MKNLKPFDLQKALAGEPVVTRDGRKALKIAHLPEIPNSSEKLICFIEGDGDISKYAEHGAYHLHRESMRDLFMSAKKKTYWVNVYSHPVMHVGILHFSEKVAMENSDFPGYVKTISFEIEE